MSRSAVLDAPRPRLPATGIAPGLVPAPRAAPDAAASPGDWAGLADRACRRIAMAAPAVAPTWDLLAVEALERLVGPQDWTAHADEACRRLTQGERLPARWRVTARRIGRGAAAGWILLSATAAVGLGIGPHTGAYSTLTVLSASMEPTITAGSVVVAVPTPARSLRVGHIVTYSAPVSGAPVVTHRIAALERRGRDLIMSTEGDALDAVDPWRTLLAPDDVLLRHRATLPHVGTAITALRHPLVQLTLRLLLPALLCLHVLRLIWRRP